ncbi:MAG: winged helix-turn-helix domain-containing protein [Prevotella sp.]|nr:winged helix-turn-helix domain-containing protein [Prevotella sp.]
MAEKKTTKKEAAAKTTATKKTTTVKKTCSKKATVAVTAENAGFKAGDVYQALAAAGSAMTICEIAKTANISEEDVLLGAGWLFKEGKIVSVEDKVTLA